MPPVCKPGVFFCPCDIELLCYHSSTPAQQGEDRRSVPIHTTTCLTSCPHSIMLAKGQGASSVGIVVGPLAARYSAMSSLPVPASFSGSAFCESARGPAPSVEFAFTFAGDGVKLQLDRAGVSLTRWYTPDVSAVTMAEDIRAFVIDGVAAPSHPQACAQSHQASMALLSHYLPTCAIEFRVIELGSAIRNQQFARGYGMEQTPTNEEQDVKVNLSILVALRQKRWIEEQARDQRVSVATVVRAMVEEAMAKESAA